MRKRQEPAQARRWARPLEDNIVKRYIRLVPRVDYSTLAELRYHIRRFLRTRELAARAVGVEPQHYQLLLQIKGLEKRRPVTMQALAERLQLRHHSTVELVDRLVKRGMVVRRRDQNDRRAVALTLSRRGEAVLRRLALYSLAELQTEGQELLAVLTRLIGRRRRPSSPGIKGGRG